MERSEWEEWIKRWERRQQQEALLLHAEILAEKSEAELTELKQRFEIAEDTSDAQAIARITNLLKEVHGKCNILTLLNLDELREFVQLLRHGEVPAKQLSHAFANDLLELGIIKWEERNHEVYARMPHDLQECWGKAQLNADFPQGVLLHQMTLAIRGMVQLYGFVWMDVLIQRMQEYFPDQITSADVRQIAKRLGNAKRIGTTIEYVYDLKIEDPETYCRFYEDLPYKEMDLDTILLYAEPHYVEHGHSSMLLKVALTSQVRSGSDVDKLICDMYHTIFTVPTHDGVTHQLQEWDITAQNLEEHIQPLIEQYQQDVMIQRYRGHTHKELMALLGEDAYEELLFWEGQGISRQTLEAWQQAKEMAFAFEEDLDDVME